VRILLLGGSGQLGWELARALAPLGEVVALGREPKDGLTGDLGTPDGLRRTVRRLQPAVIANAAAYTDVTAAETEADCAERINAHAPGVLAAEAARLDAWLVHYSTDYVFDGGGSARWREDDSPAPINVYGATKWRGEQAIRDAGGRHLIFRTQWLYAARRRNFLRAILRSAQEQASLEVVDDQYGAPTGAELVADVTAHAVRTARSRADVSGTYHLAARGETTWYGYARFVVGEARRAGWPVRVADEAIVPLDTNRSPTEARRPRNTRLDVTRLEETFGLRVPAWRAGVARVIAELIGK
jgi:dTDP-4-dehydrorhamnose reductase